MARDITKARMRKFCNILSLKKARHEPLVDVSENQTHCIIFVEQSNGYILDHVQFFWLFLS